MVDGLYVHQRYEVAGGRLESFYGLPKGLDCGCLPQTIATSHCHTVHHLFIFLLAKLFVDIILQQKKVDFYFLLV